MTTSTYGLDGLTCGHCVAAVTEEVSALDGVQDVEIALVAGGTSTLRVTATSEGATPDRAALAAAVGEAGDYRLLTA